MDTLPPSMWFLNPAAEVRRIEARCTPEHPCFDADHDKHAGKHEKHVPEAIDAAVPEDLPPGEQLFDTPRRAWAREQQRRVMTAVHAMDMFNRSSY